MGSIRKKKKREEPSFNFSEFLGVKVPDSFELQYCDECGLRKVCRREFNPHCGRTMAEHEKEMLEVFDFLESKGYEVT